MDIIQKIKEELQVEKWQVEAAVKLIDEGNTIPFISRYRKEVTGSLNDEQLRNLDERLTYLRSLEDKTEAGETMNPVPQTPINIFSHQIEAFIAASEQKQKAGLLTRQEKYRCADIAADMNRYLQTVKAELLSDGDEIFDRFRELFGDERTELEDLCAHAGQTLEYAFDFMEGTFGSSQEMVVFITELNSSAPAVRFLQENECERYFEYNKNLLFDERRADILSRLDRLGAF